MHHGPSFWAYYHELKREVQALQRAKYFGDGVYYEAHSTMQICPHGVERLLVVWSSTSRRYAGREGPRSRRFTRVPGKLEYPPGNVGTYPHLPFASAGVPTQRRRLAEVEHVNARPASSPVAVVLLSPKRERQGHA